MQDISKLPTFNIQHYITSIKEKPIDQKAMKLKVDKIYCITSYTQNQYIADVLEVYAWIIIANRHMDFREMLTTQKLQKYFCEQFLVNSVKYLILCKKFYMIELMTLTQQILVQSLIFFNKNFELLQKFPKLTHLPKYVLEIERQFYKLNYITQYPHMMIQPTKQQIQQNQHFVQQLKPDDIVDVLKIQNYGKRVIWSRGKVKKIGYASIAIEYLYQKQTFDRNIQKKSFEIAPLYTFTKNNYDWRLQLKVGDYVDYENSTGNWIRSGIQELRQIQQDGRIYKVIRFQKQQEHQQYYGIDWISVTSAKIQKQYSIVPQNEQGKKTLSHQIYLDDYNDLILDPDNISQNAVIRPQHTRSILYIQLVNYADNLKIFDKILNTISESKMNIQVVSELIGLISSIHVVFKRRFAIEYLSKLSLALTNYIRNSDEVNIRNFSKERLEIIMISLNQFYKRTITIVQRKIIIEQLQLELALRFINSDFLERKMQAVTTITQFVKMCKSNYYKLSYSELSNWITKNQIIRKIFNQKSHPELIARSTDFIKIYLNQQPDTSTLEPFLELSQPILKIVNQLFESFPKSFRNTIVEKITSKKNIKNKDCLQIIKKFGGNEIWLLENGGDGWVQVVKHKKKRLNDINQVFKQDFDVVYKITKQIDSCTESTKFKTEYFEALQNTHYLHKILENDIQLEKKIDLMHIVISNIQQIPQEQFQKFMNLWEKYESTHVEEISQKFYQFYILVLYKSNDTQIKTFFNKYFTQVQKIKNINQHSFRIFKSAFIKINENCQYIEKKVSYIYLQTYPIKRQKKETTIISVNPNKLIGMTQLMNIIFQNQKLAVIQKTLEFIEYLFDHLASFLTQSIKQFKGVFLQQCLQKLYESTSYEKYLKIIENILNESQRQGNGNLQSLSALLPPQKLKIAIIDCFNVTKRKFLFEVDSNLTLYELRFAIGKQISAFIHEMTILIDGKVLDERLNGYTIHQAKLKGPLTIQRKIKIQKSNLTQGGKLTPAARRIFEKIFRQNSTDNLMSKGQCKKFHQKCVGDITTIGESKVQKIYENYDVDKDGYLTVQDFIRFYQNSIKLRQQTVWSNLETLGVRADLKILDDLTITHVEPQTLIRYFLLHNQKFMNLLFKILSLQEQNNQKAAWNLLQRLPLCENTTFQFNLQNNYSLRYWLSIVDYKQQYNKITPNIIQKILDSDDETLSIGLKVALNLKSLDLKIFKKLIEKLILTNTKEEIQYYNKIILNYSLHLIVKCLKYQKQVQEDYIKNSINYESIFLLGLVSTNQQIRQIYRSACSEILEYSIEHNYQVFYILFNLIYKNFQKCNKSSLYTEYFQLFSHLLEMLNNKSAILEKLQLNWTILSKSMIQLFKSHKCTEERLSSPPDWVVQGFMKVLSKLLDSKTIQFFIDLVPYLFQTLLFPEGGVNKLKNPQTRKEAYQLIYQICAVGNNNKGDNGIQLLFNSGFRKIYKSMSNNKIQTTYSYFGSYNQIRSELGYAGIRNLGCICYMIAMIQQFYMTRPFRYLVLMTDDKQPQCLVKRGSKEFDDNVFHQFQNMFANLQLTQRQEFNPDEFCYSFKDFEGNPVNVSIQQDAQQFLNMIFDKLQNGFKNTPFKHALENIYGGKSCTQLICTSCNAVKQNYQNFYNLSLQVKGFKNIDESFKKYISGEVVSDYKCDACGKKSDTIKKSSVSSLPNYFIIHLQRICFNYDKFENQKVNSRWEFPHTLNIYDYTIHKQKKIKNSDQFQYQLRGIVVHIGSAEYGHYFSYIKTEENQWLEFNDQRVRQFDPKDIETECFGGEHWRRQNQSAYLLVYEKKIKKKIQLEFGSIDQQQLLAKNLRLNNLVLKKNDTNKVKLDKQKQQQKIVEKQQKIVATLDVDKVPSYISQKLLNKINKSNQQFSMNLNVSNNEFAHFVYRILSIDPPANLKTEYLELCYQCFNLKQQHLENSQLYLSQWMAKRFRQLIVGSGWQFFNTSVNNWEKQIISHEKSSRISIKNLLVSVISDIVETNKFQEINVESIEDELLKQKLEKIQDFLDKTLDMLNNQIPKNWMRFQQYFQFWIELLRENKWVKQYAYKNKLLLKLFDFILQNNSPLKTNLKRSSMGSKFTSPQYQFPIQIISILSAPPYKFTPIEKLCLNHYMFLEKLTKHHPKVCKIISLVCKNDQINSERFAYMLLVNTSKVTHSDDIKPIIEAIHQFLEIDDNLKHKRVQWILGYPQIVYHQKTNSFGLYGINSVSEHVYCFKSALRFDPILQQVNAIREKYQHVAALLVSMLLQLDKDGYIYLNDYPSYLLLNQDYVSWFGPFVQSYYQDTRKAYAGSNYVGYGDRIKELWTNKRLKEKNYRNWLIGQTITHQIVKMQSTPQNIQIAQIEYTCAIIESKATLKRNDSIPSDLIYPRTGTITSDPKVLKKFKNIEFFISKTINHIPAGANQQNEDQTGSEDQNSSFVNPYENFSKANIIKKITFKNLNKYSVIIICKLTKKSNNFNIPQGQVTFEINSEKQQSFFITKIHPEEAWGELEYSIQVNEAFSRDGSEDWPQQIITFVNQHDNVPQNNDYESN